MCGHCQFVRGTIEKMIDILIHTYVDKQHGGRISAANQRRTTSCIRGEAALSQEIELSTKQYEC
jgi:hypothetical protein